MNASAAPSEPCQASKTAWTPDLSELQRAALAVCDEQASLRVLHAFGQDRNVPVCLPCFRVLRKVSDTMIIVDQLRPRDPTMIQEVKKEKS